MSADFMFTSESVTEGHPDKLCDQISDGIVDRFLQRDPFSRVIAECAVSTSILFIATRFSSEARVDVTKVAREVIGQIGYEQAAFNSKTCSIVTSQSEMPVSNGDIFDERRLTDQDMDRCTVKNQVNVFGYACDQTAACMPLPIWAAHKLARRLTSVRLQKILPYLGPDGKTQVGIEYRERKPYRIHSLTVVASQNREGEPGLKQLVSDIIDHVVRPVFHGDEIQPDNQTGVFINPDGPFVTGGPAIHSGLTGRKNAIDTYGEFARHSGAALSGKDPTRIDRVGAYAARYAAKNVVVAGIAPECEVQLSYSIGMARPVSVQVQTFGTGHIPDEQIAALLARYFDFRLAAIIKQFNLRYLPANVKGGFYRKLAAYGHVGRLDIGLPWEVTDKAQMLRQAALP
jgi:S-adenosylmethionine synthetase